MQMCEKGKKSKILNVLCILLSILLLFSIMETAIFAEKDSEYKDLKLIPGGMAFGVKFFTKGVLVVGISGVKSNQKEEFPARDAGIKTKDIIVSVNNTDVNSIKEFSDIVESAGGKELNVRLTRNGQNMDVKLIAVKDSVDGRYKAGVLLRDSTAGIGTVTFINAETGEFGGLGHGICDVDTGELMPLRRGVAMKVEIGGVVKGKVGTPGEIKGYFLPEKCGNVFGNTLCGVFGIFSELPSQLQPAMSIGLRDEIQEGEAKIISTLGSDGPQTYTIEISKINRDGTDNKNFVIKVTDSKLIERTSGIIQGMSGSPIIQNGKLIGAVTHVLINDPATGYGIFIENMLNAAQMPMAKAS